MAKEEFSDYPSKDVDSSNSTKSFDDSDRKEILGLLTRPTTRVSQTNDGNLEIEVADELGWTDDSDNEEISEGELERREAAHTIAVLQMEEEADFRRREAARQMELALKRLRQADIEEAKRKIQVAVPRGRTDETASEEISEGEEDRSEAARNIAMLQTQDEADARKREDSQATLAEAEEGTHRIQNTESWGRIDDISEEEQERRETAHNIAVLQMQEEADFRRREAARQMEQAEKRLREAEAEEAKRKAAIVQQRRLDEVRRQQEELEDEQRKREILRRLEYEENRFRDEAESRLRKEQRLLEETQKAVENARTQTRTEKDETDRRDKAQELALMGEEMERRRARQEEDQLRLKEEARMQEAALTNLRNEKARKKKEEDERKRIATQQAIAAQGMAAQLSKQREERLERERLEKTRQEQERLERERLEREAAERQAELARKRIRIQELQRLKSVAKERERKLNEEKRRRALAAVDDPSSSSDSQSTASFAPPDPPIHVHPDSPSRGSYSFATATSNRRYPSKRNTAAVTKDQNDSASEAKRHLRILVRPLLSWRSDPRESFSDWKVVVRHQGTHQVEDYHVHRNIVGYGPRKSRYFAKEFLEFDRLVKTKERNPDPVSQLTLPSGLAQVISFALDYLYLTEGDTQPTLTAEKACLVYKLAERLEMPTLQTTVAEFYRQHIKVSNMGKFLRAATVNDASKLTFVAKARIGSLVTEDPTCARLIKPMFLVQLSEMLQEHRATLRSSSMAKKRTSTDFEKMERLQSKRWSRAIVYCSQATGNVFDPVLLEGLVSEDSLPVIDGTASLDLLRLYETVTGGRARQRESLERRCALGLMEDWVLVERHFGSSKELRAEIHSVLSSELEQQVLIYTARRYG
jgi:hypothetical protein